MSEPTLPTNESCSGSCAICCRRFVDREIIHPAVLANYQSGIRLTPDTKIYICHECMTSSKEKP